MTLARSRKRPTAQSGGSSHPAPQSSNRRQRPRGRWPVRESGKSARRCALRNQGSVPGGTAGRGGAGNVRPSPPRALGPAPGKPGVGSVPPGGRGPGKTMAPAASKLRAEAGLGPLPRRALSQYLRLLRLYPVLTKAATRSARSGGGGHETGPGWGWGGARVGAAQSSVGR